MIRREKISAVLWFSLILGLHFISLCFKLIIIHYHTPKQTEIKFKTKIKLNHNSYIEDLFEQKRMLGRQRLFWQWCFQKPSHI